MNESTVLVEKNGFRVVARPDHYPDQPEWQGYPTVIIGLDRFTSTISESWPGATDTDAIQHAFSELGPDLFQRWVRIFGEDLLNREAAGLSENDPEAVLHVGKAYGYSRGGEWLVLSWRPVGIGAPDLDDDDKMVNWARGDAYFLTLEESFTWTPDDPAFPERVEWANVGSAYGFFTRDPKSKVDVAEQMIP